MQARVVQHIRAGDRDQALAVMLFGAFFPRAQALARPLAPLAARVGRKLGDLDDLATTIEAGDEINLALSGTSLVAPALIVAGARDRFYPPAAARGEATSDPRQRPSSVFPPRPPDGHDRDWYSGSRRAPFSGRGRPATPTRGPETAGERGPLTPSPNAGRCTAERTTGVSAPTDSSGSSNLAGWTRSAVSTGSPLPVSMSSSRNLPPIVQP